jgi:isocitrate/isopropylmalate dehydrogenase
MIASHQSSDRSHSIALIPGDGIGIEVIQQTVHVLRKLEALSKTFTLDFTDYDWSSANYLKTGEYIPEGGLDKLKSHDAILFGAVGSPGE